MGVCVIEYQKSPLNDADPHPEALQEIASKQYGKSELMQHFLGKDTSYRLFPDVAYTREEYPRVEDLANLKKKEEAIIRIKSTGEIQKFRPNPPPRFDPDVAEAVKAHVLEQHEKRIAGRSDPQQAIPTTPLPAEVTHSTGAPRTVDSFYED